MTSDESAIAGVLKTYEGALHQSDTNAVMALYAPDGVFMPQYSKSSVGADAVRAAYDLVFQTITLDATFTIVEVKQVAADWAFARTNSAGRTKINATGNRVAEANQELFVFQKIDGTWKISRYCFSTTNPAEFK